MKYILVPIDFTQHAKNTLSNACIMAEKLNLGLVLYHALPLPLSFASGTPVGTMYGALDERKKSVRQEMADLMEEVNQESKISFETVVTYGNVSRGMKQIEKHNDLALVLMTSTGASGFMENIAGSSTYQIIKEMDCPVIILPANANIGKMKTIALAGDYSESSSPSLFGQLIEITQAFFAHVEVIHLQEENTLEDDQIDIGRSLDRYLKEIPHTFHFRKYNDVEDGLITFCLDNEVDLLALIPRQHNVLEKLVKQGHTQSLLNAMPMPLMVLQD